MPSSRVNRPWPLYCSTRSFSKFDCGFFPCRSRWICFAYSGSTRETWKPSTLVADGLGGVEKTDFAEASHHFGDVFGEVFLGIQGGAGDHELRNDHVMRRGHGRLRDALPIIQSEP